MNTEQFFHCLWQDYTRITPQAEQIHRLFAVGGAEVVNDHVAFRTFADTPLELNRLEPLILAMGYVVQDEFQFKAKKLRARSYQHPDAGVPKIFLSELLIPQLSAQSQALLQQYTDQIRDTGLDQTVFWSGRHWQAPEFEDYRALMAETEYGAWLLALGLRVNHFTVSVNHLSSVFHPLGENRPDRGSLQRVITRVKQAGFSVNDTGGEIKGSADVLLEQASTVADRQWLTFADEQEYHIPTCFYEFALRYPDADGNLYQGFVEANADRIFSSTGSLKPKS